MERTIVWYLRMSVVYFAAGGFLGLLMILRPEETGHFISTHVHLNLLGFMSMMVYGVGYHILPKFSGRQVFSPVLVRVQFWFANAGLIGMSVGWLLVLKDNNPLTVTAAACSLIAAVMFTVNILKTVRPA